MEVMQVDTVTGTAATDGQLTASCADHNDRWPAIYVQPFNHVYSVSYATLTTTMMLMFLERESLCHCSLSTNSNISLLCKPYRSALDTTHSAWNGMGFDFYASFSRNRLSACISGEVSTHFG